MSKICHGASLQTILLTKSIHSKHIALAMCTISNCTSLYFFVLLLARVRSHQGLDTVAPGLFSYVGNCFPLGVLYAADFLVHVAGRIV